MFSGVVSNTSWLPCISNQYPNTSPFHSIENFPSSTARSLLDKSPNSSELSVKVTCANTNALYSCENQYLLSIESDFGSKTLCNCSKPCKTWIFAFAICADALLKLDILHSITVASSFSSSSSDGITESIKKSGLLEESSSLLNQCLYESKWTIILKVLSASFFFSRIDVKTYAMNSFTLLSRWLIADKRLIPSRQLASFITLPTTSSITSFFQWNSW